ncbi:hypothetical protein OHS70_38605 (plasmid) [Streptomyces sp. NBC_00390]|uniref:hypothetical protein n=1 Tax=Streptomyces sp. NBC_00390 TaxID=2975736 RepID=UPI002E1D3FB7
MNERLDFDPEDGPWVQTLVSRVYAARQSGDQEEADRLLAYGHAEGGETLSRIVAQLLEGLDARDTATRSGTRMKPQDVSAAAPGQLVCDFCAGLDPVAYYEVTEFGISAPGGSFLSGDRFYACPRCRQLVDAADWKGLRDWDRPQAVRHGPPHAPGGLQEAPQGRRCGIRAGNPS